MMKIESGLDRVSPYREEFCPAPAKRRILNFARAAGGAKVRAWNIPPVF
jgi:hypothetical protein